MTLYISPYRRMARLRDAMDRLLDESMAESQPQEREMVLAVDVVAQDEAFVIKALVPGLESEDLNIEILNNSVAIRGTFKHDAAEDTKFVTCELPEGNFSRIINLPTALDAGKAEASLKNGVLTLVIPKAETHRPKSIRVTAA